MTDQGREAPSAAGLLPLLVVLASAAVPLLVASRIDHRLLFDDPLITLTFAKNLVRGDGFVFNHPPAVLATTTPFFALLVASIGLVVPAPLTAIAVWASAAAWSGLSASFLLFRRDLDLSPWSAALAAALVAATGWVDGLGMETYPFAFLLVLAIALFPRGAYAAAGLASGLLFLCRGEGVLLFFILFAVAFAARATPRWSSIAGAHVSPTALTRYGLGFLPPVALWCAYALPTFGSALPTTLAAKRVQAATTLWPSFLEHLIHEWPREWAAPLGLPGLPFVGLWPVLVALGIGSLAGRHARFRVLAAWGAAYAAGYSVLGVASYHWYARPLELVTLVLLVLGLDVFARRVAAAIPTRAVRVAIVALLAIAIVFRHALPLRERVEARAEDARSHVYLEVAGWLVRNARASDSVAALEVGSLGYFTDLRTIDLVGLVTPRNLAGVARGDFGEGFWRHDPDYLVYLPFAWMYFRRILGDPRFAVSYRPAARFRRGSFEVIVFERAARRASG